MTKRQQTKPIAEPGPQHTSVSISMNSMLEKACEKHLPEDDVTYEAAFCPIPTDTGWIPSVMFYLQLQPVGDIDGFHQGEPMSPYAISQELVDAFVASFARNTLELRQELRQARQSGAEVKLGVAVADIGG